ncbi:hypothetical protein Poli38472_013925 [Pythium oligandrum]|uniref:Hpc2-related domain-containing protein n=1 Tax=Pythium oligandrum TaxID=41045 RepID=A0A8K1C2H0_PYTOL|nr:hypothetical protein Poli38472_013925 [Pythium oligandrum]|eukprot:TMW55163.1 hypothetical protein Poli38472_013925 [Pythium oligandrum]
MPAMPALSTSTQPLVKKRKVFYVQLSPTSCTEVNFKELVKAQGGATSVPPRAIDTSPSDAESRPDSPFPGDTGAPSLITPRTQRFNIIERLEKRYGGGAVVGPPVHVADGADDDDDDTASYKRGDDDDLYDSEDSFIDDTELQQNIEEIHTQARVKTKHSGFFVNAGDEIETIERQEDEAMSMEGTPVKKPKKAAKKGGAESSRAVKAFIDEWSEAASEWQPGPDVLEAMEALRRAVHELTATTSFTKVFPRQLDDALRVVDKLVVDAHPNKWRVNGYFATLMTFLPFTKQYLKSNMLRLEARDTARAAKDVLENSAASLAKQIAVYAPRVEAESAETLKEEILKDKELALSLHQLLVIQDEWIVKENDYRQMLKTEDKKHLKEQDFVQLNPRQERNRIFSRILSFFPTGLMDIPSLRALNRNAKAKATRKAPAAKPATKSPVPTPKRKVSATTPVAEPATATTAPAKRSIKPFKSRMMDETPPFTEADFDEEEQ